jgi:protein-S-isoprenylcysteine O-methyltransferase Ste14
MCAAGVERVGASAGGAGRVTQKASIAQMKLKFARHLLSIALLPFTVAVLVPLWIAQSNNISLEIGTTMPQVFAQVAGVLLLAVGLALFTASLMKFATEGEGTLAPWDPPRRLVVRGPYRYVRNPMISGVLFVLFGEALIPLSRPHFTWALIFLAMNFTYIPLVEETGLRQRFGDSYVEYCRHVPRLIPRFRPWEPDDR